jgi:apolipoprotein N-acyltransferase
VVPAGQAFVAVANGRGHGKGKDPGEARFWLVPDCAGLGVAPGFTWFGTGFTWFGTGLGQTGFWVSPTAPLWSWPSAGTQLARPGTAPCPFRP